MLNLGAWTFRPGWVMSIVAVLALAAAIALGNWQVRRAAEKLALQERLDDRSHAAAIQLPPHAVAAGEIEYSQVAARGEFLPQHTILLDNKVFKGQVGYQVLTPLRIEGGVLCVLVNRGWVAGGPRREVLPQFATPAGMQQVEGIAVSPARRYFELGPATTYGPVWQNLVLDRYAAATKLEVQPFVLQQLNAGSDGLARIQERPDTGVNMHRGYAFQWYALGVLVVILYIGLNLKRKNESQT
jgi:surfeit locus 1 family protein